MNTRKLSRLCANRAYIYTVDMLEMCDDKKQEALRYFGIIPCTNAQDLFGIKSKTKFCSLISQAIDAGLIRIVDDDESALYHPSMTVYRFHEALIPERERVEHSQHVLDKAVRTLLAALSAIEKKGLVIKEALCIHCMFLSTFRRADDATALWGSAYNYALENNLLKVDRRGHHHVRP